MSNDKKDMTEEEYLKRHLGTLEGVTNNNFDSVVEPVLESTKISELQYLTFDTSEFPCGKFYPQGTIFKIRAAQVREIQAYSMVDDSNFYDVVEKMNDMLRSCVRVKYSDGRVGSYLDIRDQDRIYLIFLIRELTFQQGNSLSVDSKCTCGETIPLELKRSCFKFHQLDSKLDNHFSPRISSYVFKIKNGKEYILTPPTIGLQKSFTDYIIRENNDKISPNLAFLKIIPFLLEGRTSITYDGIKAKLLEFEQIDDISFQFLNGAVSKMTFGIEKLSTYCGCGEEVTADMQFPNGASSVFVISNAFEAYLEE